jgi:hypothetical protein
MAARMPLASVASVARGFFLQEAADALFQAARDSHVLNRESGQLLQETT